MISYNLLLFILYILWISGSILVNANRKNLRIIGESLVISGIILLAIYVTSFWISLGRAPLRTLGETRLMYALFLSTIGIVIYYKWTVRWMAAYSLGLSILFLQINAFHPENFDKTLMPALQSVWFVPHVIVYIFAYALLGASTLIAIKGLWHTYRNEAQHSLLTRADSIVYTGFTFLTFGLLFGALWAKEAWGHYWTWDPKETWAFITWMMYLLYIHFRIHRKQSQRTALWLLSLAFVILLICWFGINYLPSAQNSVHTYSQ